MTIANNHAAFEILAHAVEQLQAIGLECMLSPSSLPQGASVALHIGDTVQAVIAADVAARRGAESAYNACSALGFAADVAAALTEATLLKAAHMAAKG